MLEVAAYGQGTFQNLGFETAVLVPVPIDGYGRVQFESAFPNWTGYVGGVPQTRALYNNAFMDSSGIGIIGSGWTNALGLSGGVISGNYTAILQAGVLLGTFTPADTTLSQTSLVPLSAESLRFRSYGSASNGPLLVFLAGQRLTLVPLGTATNYTLFGADIHGWQGQIAQLDFTVIAQRPHVENSNIFLDRIQFSNEPIPEPGVFALFGLGALIFGWRRFSKSRA